MMNFSVQEFIQSVETALNQNALPFDKQTIFQSSKAFKANYYFAENIFLAVRYNARNGRTDFALILNHQRVFGFDNLKAWHYHPYENPAEHIFCEEPTIDRIITETKIALSKAQSL